MRYYVPITLEVTMKWPAAVVLSIVLAILGFDVATLDNL